MDDIARGTIAALRPLGYEIINLGGHEVISMNGLINVLETLIGKQAIIEHRPPNLAEMLTNQADTGKASSLLGWQPQVNFDRGLPSMVDWYRSERGWAKDLSTN